jgi:hypothetical protein
MQSAGKLVFVAVSSLPGPAKPSCAVARPNCRTDLAILLAPALDCVELSLADVTKLPVSKTLTAASAMAAVNSVNVLITKRFRINLIR